MIASSGAHRFVSLWSALLWRDLRVRYKQSALGIAWALALPLTMMLLFTFLFTSALDMRSTFNIEAPYPLYAFTALVPWTFFSNSLTSCVNSLVANRNLITKIYFPREVFPLSAIGASFVDFAVALGLLAALMLYFHVRDAWHFTPAWSLALFPLVVAIQLVLTTGLGLLLAMGNLFYRDVRPMLAVLLQLLMFVSAVVVPLPQQGTAAKLLSLNPVVPLMNAYRDCLLHGRAPSVGGLAYAGIVSLLFLIVGWTWFRRASYRFAECI
jgi:ABC-type polysaccharide/polyol phosphate export permease